MYASVSVYMCVYIRIYLCVCVYIHPTNSASHWIPTNMHHSTECEFRSTTSYI